MTNLQTLSAYLQECRWCNFKEEIKNGSVYDIQLEKVPYDNGRKLFIIGQASLLDGKTVKFSMPMARKYAMPQNQNNLIIDGAIYTDALQEPDFWQTLNKFIDENDGVVTFPNGWKLKRLGIAKTEVIEANKNETSKPLGVEQSNTTLNIGNGNLAFKLERILDFSTELNPEFEMNEKLMREGCGVMPETYGGLLWETPDGKQSSCGIIQEFVKNKGDMWNHSLGYLHGKLKVHYLRQLDLTAKNCPEFVELVKNLQQKTAEMGDCLSRPDDNKNFTPEIVTPSFIRTYEKNLTVLLYQTKQTITNNLHNLPEPTKTQARELLANWDETTKKFVQNNIAKIISSEQQGYTCRVHGDFHLGQVMVTPNDDLRFIDFAGEPALPIEQRKQKHIYVRDIAGMYRSIKGYLGAVAVEDYAASAPTEEIANERKAWAQKAIKPLIDTASKEFLGERTMAEPWLALEVLRKNLYEVNYEVASRPSMAYVPIMGLSELFNTPDNGGGSMGIDNDFDNAEGM